MDAVATYTYIHELEGRHTLFPRIAARNVSNGFKEGEGDEREREGHWPPNRRFLSCQRVIRRPDARETPFTIGGYVEDALLLFN